jgi:hypothetical protein
VRARDKTTVIIRMRIPQGGDGIRALRQALKVLLRRFGLRAISVTEVAE